MKTEFRPIALLLHGNCNEEKVAGLLLSVKFLEMEKLTFTDSKMILSEIFSIIDPDFLIKVMWNNDEKRLFRQASMSLIAFSIQTGYSSIFRDSAPRFVELLFASLEFSASTDYGTSQSMSDQKYDMQFVLDLLTVIKWITAEGGCSTIRTVLLKSISHAGKVTTELPAYFYPFLSDYVMDLSQMLFSARNFSSPDEDSDILPTLCAEMLRMFIVKGFHGGAPEAVRDSALRCCLHFLSTKSAFNPAWSLQEMSDGDEENLHSERPLSPALPPAASTSTLKEKEIAPPEILSNTTIDRSSLKCPSSETGTFPMLLVSIIGIEVHLLLEEALALFKEPQGEPQIPSYGELRDPSVQRQKKYDEVKLNLNSEYTLLRIKRILKMIPCCMSLLNTTILLLVGREEGEDAIVEAHWSLLSSPVILHIRQTVHNIFQKVFDFLKEISDISSETLTTIYHGDSSVSENNAFAEIRSIYRTDALLLNVVRQITAALCLWVLEDEDMRDSFVQNLPLMLTWSVVPMYFSDTPDAHNLLMKNSNGVGAEEWTASTVTVWKALLDPLMYAQNEVEDAGDVLHYLLPCLIAISGDMMAEDELADKVCTLNGGSLLCRLVNLALLVCKNATSLREEYQKLNMTSSSKQKSQNYHNVRDVADAGDSKALLDRFCNTCCAACDQLTFFFEWKQKEIILLRKGESETEALTALFSLSKETFPFIPKMAPFSLSKSKRRQEDRHAERLACILAAASSILSDSDSKNIDSTIVTTLSSLGCAVSDLIIVLGLISID